MTRIEGSHFVERPSQRLKCSRASVWKKRMYATTASLSSTGMSYLARSSSSVMPASSGSRAWAPPAGAGSASGVPSSEAPCARARSRATGSQPPSPTARPSRGPVPGAAGSRPAFSSALRTASSSAALLSTSACESSSSGSLAAASTFSTVCSGLPAPPVAGKAVCWAAGATRASAFGAVATAAASSGSALAADAAAMISAASAAGSPVRSSKRCSFTSFLEPPRENAIGTRVACQNPKSTSVSAVFLHVQRADPGLPGKNHREPSCIPESTGGTGGSLFAAGGQLGDEFPHPPPRVGRSFQLGNVSTSGNDLDLRAGHVAAEILDARDGKQPVLLAPEDEDLRSNVPQHRAAGRAGDVGAGVVEDALDGRRGPAPRQIAGDQPEEPWRAMEEKLRHARRADALVLEARGEQLEGRLREIGSGRIEADHSGHLVGSRVRRVERERATEGTADHGDLAVVGVHPIHDRGDHLAVLDRRERASRWGRRPPVAGQFEEHQAGREIEERRDERGHRIRRSPEAVQEQHGGATAASRERVPMHAVAPDGARPALRALCEKRGVR